MDREDSDQCKLTLNFIEIIVAPLYKKLVKIFPPLQICLDNLEKNRLRWNEESQLRKEKTEEKLFTGPNVINLMPYLPKAKK
jgi:hypothetical protein